MTRPLSRFLVTLGIFALLAAPSRLVAQASSASDTKQIEKTADPLKASLGWASPDGPLLNLKGKLAYYPEPHSEAAKNINRIFGTLDGGVTMGYVTFDADGAYSPRQVATRKAILALRLGLWYAGGIDLRPWRLHDPVVSPFLDFHERLANFKASGETKNIGQFAPGAGFALTVPYGYKLTSWLVCHHPLRTRPCLENGVEPITPSENETHGGKPAYTEDTQPVISAAYYWSAQKDPTQFASDVKTNQIVTKLNWTFTIPYVSLPRARWPFQLATEIAATTPTTGTSRKTEWKEDVGLIFENKSAAKPILKYVSGSKEGLQFKTSVLAGIAWDITKTHLHKKKETTD